jgi:hypothetical protein
MTGPKIYGGRWAISPGPRLGSGGQSEVFRATDTTGELVGEFALKRVINAKRHERYGQLELAAALIATETINCEVREAKIDLNLVATGQNAGYRPLGGAELELQDKIREATRKHVFQILLCDHHHSIVTTLVSIVGRSDPPSVVPIQPARDHDLGVIFIYKFSVTNRSPEQPLEAGFLTEKGKLGSYQTFLSTPTVSRQVPHSRGVQQHQQLSAVMRQFQPTFSLHRNFKASDWPANKDDLRIVLLEAIDVFIEYLGSRI